MSAPVICLMGPTAAGKTDAAIELVRRFGCEIVSVDSALVYKRMDIGTAKPDAQMQAIAPHSLIDLIEPWEQYSTAQFVEDCQREITRIQAAGSIPLLAGGSMMYFHSLLVGLSDLPEASAQMRHEISLEIQQRGLDALHDGLYEIDPEAAARIARGDTQRITRALEVWRLTGKSLSQWHKDQPPKAATWPSLQLVISPVDRSILHQRIEQRFIHMLDHGFIDEVKSLKADPRIQANMTSMRSVGYRQVWQYLDDEYDHKTMIHKGVVATRQLAKRQLTWLRRFSEAQWFEPNPSDIDKLYRLVEKSIQCD